jgi:hypothetical protein
LYVDLPSASLGQKKRSREIQLKSGAQDKGEGLQ